MIVVVIPLHLWAFEVIVAAVVVGVAAVVVIGRYTALRSAAGDKPVHRSDKRKMRKAATEARWAAARLLEHHGDQSITGKVKVT